MSKLIFGCGYLGKRVAARYVAQADTVYAVTRSAARAAELEAAGLLPVVADITRRETLASLPEVETVIVAVGFDRSTGLSIHQTYVAGMENVLAALPTTVTRVIYISSTGVYGQGDGSVVDEDSPTEPTRAGGRACLAAEELLARYLLGRGAVVLRLAGIYGPGRLPRSAQLIDREPLPVDPETYLNLIHVDDAAEAVLAADRLDPAAALRRFCISDGHPILRGDYFAELARQLDTPLPVFEPDAAAAGGEPRRGSGSKRVSNARMLAELDFTLTYPTWREGLAASLAAAG
ncbi:MAG: SDR family NAD(P)-dependent oxidoreductase [Planctomycetota bacterium]|nr:MAG: SDR family NAD(P)-dependent oxidoreductase [Planctomycetota bacterium]REJ89392.1 MAG: SDR family NAD(P)-dependent oxidoreductase [Planctomycetota bacterium]